MLSYPVPKNILPSDVVEKSQRKRELKNQEQAGSKEENVDT
jgi:hypothetical protein